MPIGRGYTPVAPLAGADLVRLLYLDEAGTNPTHPHACAAGVLIDGDQDWPEVDRRIVALIEKHIEPERRLGFVFHATDIYHGTGYFDRRKARWKERERSSHRFGDDPNRAVDSGYFWRL